MVRCLNLLNCIAKLSTALLVLIVFTGFSEELVKSDSAAIMTDSRGRYTEEREICGETKDTPKLDQATCDNTTGCIKCVDKKKWCFKETELIVKTPDHRWVFSGAPIIDLVEDNQGSAVWNALGSPDRFSVSLNNPNEIRVKILTSSRSIKVRICAKARYYP